MTYTTVGMLAKLANTYGTAPSDIVFMAEEEGYEAVNRERKGRDDRSTGPALDSA